MTSVRRARSALIVTLAAVLLSCDSALDDDPTGNQGSFVIGVSPPSITLSQNTSDFITLVLQRSGGFDGVVSLAVSALPNGVSATLDPAQLAGVTGVARINLATSATAAPGTTIVTVTGSSGDRQSTVNFTLTVRAAPAYALTVPATATVAAGSTSDVTVNISRSNFTGGVTLALVNPPAGITGTFVPSPSTTDASVLSVSVGGTVAPGIYTLTIRGTAGNLSDRTTSLQLTVIPASTASNNVEYQFCQPDDVPAFFAYQDGNGPWQALNGTTAGSVTRFGIRLTTGRGGIMLVYPFTLEGSRARRAGASSRLAAHRSTGRVERKAPPVARRAQAAVVAYETLVLHGSTAELATDGVQACAISPPAKTIRGTVAGLSNFQYSVLSLGSISTIFEGGVNMNPVTFEGVEGGVVDFMGSRLPSTGAAPDRAVVFRNLNIPDGGTLPSTIDFNGPASFVPASASVTLTGAPGQRFEVYSDVVTANGEILLWNDIGPSTVSPRPWAGLPDSRLAPGELHNIIVFASVQANSTDFRIASKFAGPVSNQTVAFGPEVDPATVSQVSAGAYPRFRFQGSLPTDYNKGVIVSVNPNDGSYFTVLVTNAWLAAAGSAATYDLTMPDVAGLPGFPAVSRLKQGLNYVTTEAFGFTGSGTFSAIPSAGVEAKTSIRTRTISVP